MKITNVLAREIYDSRGWPTIQCEVVLDDNVSFVSSVPTGLSRGRYEACDLRDGDKRLWGHGVQKAIDNIENIIAPELIGNEPQVFEADLKMIELDGTSDKSHLGANATLAVSMSLYRAQAHMEGIELFELIAYLSGSESVTMPFPFLNVINGGIHAENNCNIQEFMIVPVGFNSFRESMESAIVIFHELKNVLHKHGKHTLVGDEGGFAPNFKSDEEALDILTETLEKVPFDTGHCVIALDVAASQLYDAALGAYIVNGKRFTTDDMLTWYEKLVSLYPIYSIEDGLDQDDWDGWKSLYALFGDRMQIVGDDIFATNKDRIITALENDIHAGVIVKPNQIGTITETIQAIQLCKENQLTTIVSHRSGDTEDNFIADLAVGTSCGQIKSGGCSRSERLSKYNRLLRIEDTLMRNMFRV